MSLSRAILPPALSLSLAGLIGCGPGYTVVPVSGTVTANGKPLADVKVTFVAESGNRAQTNGVGQTGPDGAFTVSSSDHSGLSPGNYKVIVTPPIAIPGWDKLPDIVKEDPLLPREDLARLGPGRAKKGGLSEQDFDVEVTPEKSEYHFELKGPASRKAAAGR